MSRPASLRALRLQLQRTNLTTSIRRQSFHIRSVRPQTPRHQATALPRLTVIRDFHKSRAVCIDVTEDADKDTLKESEPHDTPDNPTPISEDDFHERADTFLETLLEKLEGMHEQGGIISDVEYSVSTDGRMGTLA